MGDGQRSLRQKILGGLTIMVEEPIEMQMAASGLT